MCLLSNVVLGRRDNKRIVHLANTLHIPYYYCAMFWEQKPASRPFHWALKQMQGSAENTAMIGDQVFTDILGAKRVGMVAVLVTPLGPDHWATTLSRRRCKERLLIKELGLEPA